MQLAGNLVEELEIIVSKVQILLGSYNRRSKENQHPLPPVSGVGFGVR